MSNRVPCRCPVCNGNGLVPPGFYGQTSGQWSTTLTTPESCRSCGGSGIVWEPPQEALAGDAVSETVSVPRELAGLLMRAAVNLARIPMTMEQINSSPYRELAMIIKRIIESGWHWTPEVERQAQEALAGDAGKEAHDDTTD